MIGQGRPSTSPRSFCLSVPVGVCGCCRFALAAWLVLMLCDPAAAESTMRVRISWGGGVERVWYGNVAISRGRLSEPRPLGIEADEPGSMWLDARWTYVHPLPDDLRPDDGPAAMPPEHLVIRQRSPRTYDAVDLTVTGPPDAKLLIELAAGGARTHPRAESDQQSGWIVVPLENLLDGFHNVDLDDQGNRLLVQRSPGDDLPVVLKRRGLVFSPGELFEFDVMPRLPAAEPGSKVRIKVEVLAGRGSQVLSSGEHTAWAGQTAPLRQAIRVPEPEGVYDVMISATEDAGLRWAQSVTSGLKWKKQPLAQRKIQLLVLDAEQPRLPLGTGSPMNQLVEEIDPANPKWWERFARLPHWRRSGRPWKGPLGNGHSRIWQHPLGQVVRLEPEAGTDAEGPSAGEVAWEAYSLPIEKPGWPHVLEVDYPSDVPQTLGISLIEPNAAGAVFPIGLDSGADVAREVVGQPAAPRWLHHRVVFWPRTKAPMVLVTNRRKGSPAVYGKIRVLSGSQRLPRAFPAAGPPPARLWAAYLDRPLLPENFSASQTLGSLDEGVDDWVTFYQGGARLVDYLHYVGFGGLMIAVLADGSTIYPSDILQPTPRYDTGTFLREGQDPVQKDGLEMLLRLFDRDRLQLIPALEFAAPLPELEALLRRGGPESEGIGWVGPDGRTWLETHLPVRGLAPYYNVLDPRVQNAMLAVVRELVSQYSHHASFSGLAIQLSGYGYAQLPGPDWGLDDATITRFEQDTGILVPGSGPERFAGRAQFLSSEHPREWLRWRADQLTRFYRRIRDELRAVRSDAQLYLAGATLFDGEEMQRRLRPVLPQRLTVAEALLLVGIDAGQYGQDEGIILLRPEKKSPGGSLASQAVDLEIRQMEDFDRYFQGLPTPGSLYFHDPQELRLASFDQKSPFQPSYTWLITQAAPSDLRNRRRFVHSLSTLDAQVIFDGGWQLVMGQEDSIRQLIAAYRQLPAVTFQALTDPPGGASSQPVAVRYATHADSTYVYVVNDAPFSTRAKVRLTCPNGCRLGELSGLRQVAPLRRDGLGTYWSVDLEPYDLVAVRLSSKEVTLTGVEVYWSEQIRAELETRLAELKDRTAVLRSPPVLEALKNSDFELPPAADGRIPGWAGVGVGLDPSQPYHGSQAVRMASAGPVATLVSEPFDAPATGRLTMSVWLRTADPANQPPLRLALVGQLEGRDFLRFVRVGLDDGSHPFVPQLDSQWQRIDVRVDDLPPEGLSPLQLRFDLLSPGEVWIDDVGLSDLVFSDREWKQLIKLIAPADLKLEKGRVGDCLALLEGYWPRFLMANVPLVEQPAGAKPAPERPTTSAAPEVPVRTSGLLDRIKGLLPDRLRF